MDECDHAGIWQVDFQIAEIKTGEKLKPEIAIQEFGEKVFVFDGGEKWFIPSFIEFQYGELNPENRAHNSVLSILRKHNLVDLENNNKPLTSPLQGAMDMDKDKDKVKDKEKGRPKVFVKPTLVQVSDYFKEIKFSENPETFLNFYESKGWKVGNTPMKDWKAACRTWKGKRPENVITESKTEKPKYHQPVNWDEFLKEDDENKS